MLRAAPNGSSDVLPGAFDSGTSRTAATMPTRASGTLMRKTDCQAKCSSRKPPSTGPMTMPSEKTLDQTAIALGRSVSVKMSATIESVDGLARAAPSPMKARSAIS